MSLKLATSWKACTTSSLPNERVTKQQSKLVLLVDFVSRSLYKRLNSTLGVGEASEPWLVEEPRSCPQACYRKGVWRNAVANLRCEIEGRVVYPS